MRWLALLLVFLLAGCAGRGWAPVADGGPARQVEKGKAGSAAVSDTRLYTVKKGDTLHGIALDHGIDYRDLVAWNGIENPNRIRVGQELRVSPPAPVAAPAAAPLADGAEIRPVVQEGGVVSRPLEGGAAAPQPAPVLVASSETLKQVPKGGKLPYSEENLARLRAQNEAAPSGAPPMPAEKSVPSPAANDGDDVIEWSWPANGRLLASFSDAGSGEANKGIDVAGKLGDPVLAAAAGKVVYVGSGLRGYGSLVIVRHNAAFLSAYAHNSRILVKEGQAVTRGQRIADLGSSDADQPKLHFEVRHQGKPVDPLKHLPPR